MKEWIEEILKAHNIRATVGLVDYLYNIFVHSMGLEPNNDWQEYPKHKPSESSITKRYNVTKTNGRVYAIEYFKGCDWSDVIAFKPIPVEPFVKPINDIEMIDEIIHAMHLLNNSRQIYDKQVKWLHELKSKTINQKGTS